MTRPENKFFKKPPESLIEKLIVQIEFLESAFEDELERTIIDPEKEELKGAIERTATRLKTLYNIKAKRPVLAENLELLLEYGNTKKEPEIANYPRILDSNTPKP